MSPKKPSAITMMQDDDQAELLEVISQRNVIDVVEERLKRFIVTSGLRPGDKLPSENELSKKLKVSRNAIREGLRSLQGQGLIDVHHGRGRYLSHFDFKVITNSLAYSLVFDKSSLKDLLHIRRILELGFLGEAATKLDRNDHKALEEVLKMMWKKLEAFKTFVPEDMEFHRLLFRKLNNQPLLNLLEVFWLLFQEVEENSEHTREQLEEAVRYHQAILEALKAGEIERAKENLNMHLIDAQRRIEEAEVLMPRTQATS